MKKHYIDIALFLGFLILSTLGILLIFRPFFIAIFLAIVIAIVSRPFYNQIKQKLKTNSSLTSAITILVILLILILPTILIGQFLAGEAKNLYTNYFPSQPTTEYLSNLIEPIKDYLPNIDLGVIKNQISNWLTNNLNLSSIFSGAINTITSLLVFFFCLFYLMKDGPKLKNKLIELSPLTKDQSIKLIKKVENTIFSVVVGSLLIAVIQGLLTALGFAIFGAPQPIIWGSLAVIAALIPGIGPIVIILPAALILYLNTNIIGAVGLTIWGIVLVGSIDNILRPVLIERGTKIHSVLILISVLGGLMTLGPIGFLAGPVMVSIFLSLLDIYSDNQKEQYGII